MRRTSKFGTRRAAGTITPARRELVVPDHRCWGITEHAVRRGRQDHRIGSIDWTSVDDVQPGQEVVWWESSRAGGCALQVALQIFKIALPRSLGSPTTASLEHSRPPLGRAEVSHRAGTHGV